MRVKITAALGIALALSVGSLAQVAPGAHERVNVLEMGEEFKATSVPNLNPVAGPALIDLNRDLHQRPVVFVYWIAGNTRSEDVLLEFQELGKELGRDKLAIFGVVVKRPGRGVELIRRRIEARGITLPVIDDLAYHMGQMFQVRSVPHVTVLDSDARLRLTNGGSLLQQLEADFNLEKLLRRAAAGKTIGTYGTLDTYEPVTELIGRRCPEFDAPPMGGSGSESFRGQLVDDRVNAFVYWSVECPHCRSYLPKLNEWLEANPGRLNVISVAAVHNPAAKIKTEQFCKVSDFDFPVMFDEDHRIRDLYRVTSTPTILLIGPDGVVDSVVNTDQEIGEAVEASHERLFPRSAS